MPKPMKLKPIKLTVWFTNGKSQELRFDSCAEGERHLDELRSCPVYGAQFSWFAIDKEVR